MSLRRLVCALLLLAAVSGDGLAGATRAGLPNGIASGDVTQRSAVLWARAGTAGTVHFELARRPAFLLLVWSAQLEVADARIPAKVQVDGLEPDTRYFYRVSSPNGEQLTGTFRTAAESAARRALRFGVSGDWRGELAPYPSISNAPWRGLDFFVELGDTVYADYPSPAVPADQARTLDELRDKHREGYGERFGIASWARLRSMMPVYATIDDHEVTNDFAGGAPADTDMRFPETEGLINETALYANGLRAFVDYNPIVDTIYSTIGDTRTDGRPDLYRYRTFGNQAALCLVDARSFRDAPLAPVEDPLEPSQVSDFIARSFDIDPTTFQPLPRRTMLGTRQLERLKADLVQAQADGITWKLIMLPEPIQSLTVILAEDRFEGYARERSEILGFIHDHGIENVVFVSADIHGTVVNNLTYRRREEVVQALATSGDALAAPRIPVAAFEITTGSVAFDAPFGQTVLALVDMVPGAAELLEKALALVGFESLDEFFALPPIVQNAVLQLVSAQLLTLFGEDPVGLHNTPGLDVERLRGLYMSVVSYGWTEFEIDPLSRELQVTTYATQPYTQAEMEADPEAVSARRPRVLSQFVVRPN
jgi:alkaline phosphatase D